MVSSFQEIGNNTEKDYENNRNNWTKLSVAIVWLVVTRRKKIKKSRKVPHCACAEHSLHCKLKSEVTLCSGKIVKGKETLLMEQEENVECALGEQKMKCTMHHKQNVHRCNRNDNVIVVASFIATLVVLQLSYGNAVDALPSKDVQPSLKINKCCEKFEIYMDGRCTIAKESNSSES